MSQENALLLARRLAEAGVNFVAVFDGQTNGQDTNWDSHEKLFTRHRQLISLNDEAFSALIEDLHTRGLLDSTLVCWGGEMGRLPVIQNDAGPASVGRDHNTYGFSAWLAASVPATAAGRRTAAGSGSRRHEPCR